MSMILAIAMMLSIMCVPVNAATQSKYYTDVYTTDSYHDAVIYLYDHNIMVGYTATTFAPFGNLTRAEVVTILWRMLNKPEPYGVISSFPDCDSGAYYYKAVLWACSQSVGIVAGYENGNFGPTDLVSNQDLLTFLYRFACHCGYEDSTDIDQQAYYKSIFNNNSNLIFKETFWEYSKVAVGWAYGLGFIRNYSIQGTVSAKRGNTAEYMYNFYKCFQKKYSLTIVNTDDLDRASYCANGMSALFDRCGAEPSGFVNIAEQSMATKMNNAFAEENNEIDEIELEDSVSNSDDTIMYDSSELEYRSGNFDVSAFVDEFVGRTDNLSDTSHFLAAGSRMLTGSCYIKTLASCESDEKSWAYLAASFWCKGAGHDIDSGADINMYADANKDGRISLYELFCYSYINIEQHYPEQHVDYYPEFDSYIIFEKNY